MGAWGTGSFDNDDAKDWVYELEGADDLELARDALVDAAERHGYLDARDGAVALAAAEVVAAACGRPGAALPEEVQAWLETVNPSPTADDRALAAKAVARVRGNASEIAELWHDAGATTETDWSAGLDDLIRRLA